MIVVLAGDSHGNLAYMRSVMRYAQTHNADLVMQLGDFGFVWQNSNAAMAALSQVVDDAGIPLWWLDGNHENFDRLARKWGCTPDGSAPVRMVSAPHLIDTLPDGIVYRERPEIVYMPRGTILDWDGVTVGVCGGAGSIDMLGRAPHVSWWQQEAVTATDLIRITEAGKKVDVMLSHDAPYLARPLEAKMNARTNGWNIPQRVLDYCEQSRSWLAAIADGWQPQVVFHGHHHYSYEGRYEAAHGPVHMIGMDCDGVSGDGVNPRRGSVYVLDTTDIPSTGET